MEIFFSAVVSELISRFISFLIEKYVKPTNMEEKLRRLHQLSLRIHTIIEEAEGRYITNQQMLLQLKMLMDSLYQGYYMLDALKYQAQEEVETKDDMSHDHYSVAISSFNSAKRLRFMNTSTAKSIVFGGEDIHKLQSVLGSLEMMIEDVKEFVILLGTYPRIFRQPYNTYLFMDKCMFGRHVERELIMNFLLQQEPPGSPNRGVLPVIGHYGVGKKTLVEHVCNDERVRNHFSLIVLFDENHLRNRMLASLRDGGEVKHEKFVISRSLVIIEFVHEADEEEWKRFYSSICYMASGSKVIILSTMEKVVNWGTTHPVRLKNLSQEEYWYFFKALAFGSADPKEHPKLASLGMAIATKLCRSFIHASVVGGLLRANLNQQFWYNILRAIMEVRQKYVCRFGAHPDDLIEKNHAIHLTMTAFLDAPVYFTYNLKEISSVPKELPKISWRDTIIGRTIPPEKKFEVLLWKSSIPPYCSYTATFVKEKHRQVATKRKHI